MNLSTTYMGFELPHPVIPGASPSLFYTNPAVFPAPGPNNCQHCAMSCMR
jgi:hypothetical protein